MAPAHKGKDRLHGQDNNPETTKSPTRKPVPTGHGGRCLCCACSDCPIAGLYGHQEDQKSDSIRALFTDHPYVIIAILAFIIILFVMIGLYWYYFKQRPRLNLSNQTRTTALKYKGSSHPANSAPAKSTKSITTKKDTKKDTRKETKKETKRERSHSVKTNKKTTKRQTTKEKALKQTGKLTTRRANMMANLHPSETNTNKKKVKKNK